MYVRSLWMLPLLLVGVHAATKQWLHNTNYGNAANWDAGRLPCPLDIIRFPHSSPAVYVTSNVSAREIILPANGEFMLSNGFSLSAVAPGDDSSWSDHTAACNSSAQVEFNRTVPEDWFNPDNWCELSAAGECVDPQPLRLDSERVPCQSDDVIFPPHSSFLVQITTVQNVRLNSLKIGEQHLKTQRQLRTFLQSEASKTQFKIGKGTSVKINKNACRDVTGCACGNDNTERVALICARTRSQCAPRLCDAPVQPRGHCCALCGAVMMLDYGASFAFRKLQRLALNRFLDTKTQKTVSKLSNNRIQILVVDNLDGENAKNNANEIYKYIQNDMKSRRLLGVTNVRLQTSGKGIYATESSSHTSSRRTASIVGIVISIIVVVLLIAFAMYCLIDRSQCQHFRDKLPPSIIFRRFGTEEEAEESVEMGDSVRYIDIMNRTQQQTTFDNPMYGFDEKPAQPDECKQENNNLVNNNQPTALDAAAVSTEQQTIQREKQPIQRASSFSNPLFSDKPTDSNYLDDTTIQLNPAFNADDVEDSSI